MKFLKSTRSKAFAAVAAVMALSASAAYAFDCDSYCSMQADVAAQNAKQQMLNSALNYCYSQQYGGPGCVISVQSSANDVYNSVYSQVKQQCMSSCHS